MKIYILRLIYWLILKHAWNSEEERAWLKREWTQLKKIFVFTKFWGWNTTQTHQNVTGAFSCKWSGSGKGQIEPNKNFSFRVKERYLTTSFQAEVSLLGSYPLSPRELIMPSLWKRESWSCSRWSYSLTTWKFSLYKAYQQLKLFCLSGVLQSW